MPDYIFVLTASEEVRVKRIRDRYSKDLLEIDFIYQNQVNDMFCRLGFPIIDTSISTVEETVELILKQIK